MTGVHDHVAILASAGTGKTFRLTSRYIALLASGVRAERILATTFTKKAAGEILERVLSRLATASLHEQAARELSEQTGCERMLAPTEWQAVLGSLARSLDRASVLTLDAFFARLASAFALELGGLVRWEVAEEDTLEQLRSSAIAAVLQSGDRETMLGLLRAMTPGGISRSVHLDIDRAVQEAHAAYAASEEGAWERLSVPAPVEREVFDAAVRRLQGFVAPTTKAGGPRKHWVNALEKIKESVASGRWTEFVEIELVRRVVSGSDFDRVAIPPELSAIVTPFLQQAAACVLGDLASRNRATRELMARYDVAMSAEKSSRGLLAFDDVPRMLLRTSMHDRLHEVYYKLDAKLSHVMLDEFQDTSIVQWRLLEPLVDEVVSGEGVDDSDGSGRSFLCVGDVKQSLYAWRDAEPELLLNVHERWPQVREEDLARNRRSSPVIMDAVNTVFGSLAENAAFPDSPVECELCDRVAAARWQSRFVSHTAHQSFAGHVVLRTCPEPADSRHREPIVRFAAQRIAELHRDAPGASIGVLFRSKKDIPLMKHLLMSEHGVHASEEAGNPLSDSPSVSVVLSLLLLADHPGNTAAAFHVASTPLGRFVGLEMAHDGAAEGVRAGPESECVRRVATAVRSDILSLGLARTIQRWHCGVLDECNARDNDRLLRLVRLARDFEERAGSAAFRATEFVNLVETRRVDDPTAAPVRLMTLHASKGLEFDCVVLADLEAAIAVRTPRVLTGRSAIDGPIDFVSLCPKKAAMSLSPELNQRYAEWRQRTIRDEICALYVGMTRAVHSLEMIIAPTDKETMGLSHAGILRGALAPTSAQPGQVLWEIGDAAWAKERGASKGQVGPAVKSALASGIYRALSPLDPDVSPRLEWGVRTRFIPARTPAGPEGAAYVLPTELIGARDAARLRGSLVHAWLELISWLDDGEPSDAELARAAAGLGVTRGKELTRYMEWFRRALRSNSVREALMRPVVSGGLNGSTHVWREQAFAVRTNAGVLSGRFDRLVVELVEGAVLDPGASIALVDPAMVRAAEVIDFKTDVFDVTDAAAIAARSERYAGQLAAYEEAAALLLGVDRGIVRSRLVFVSV